jgi:peroxiredoxin
MNTSFFKTYFVEFCLIKIKHFSKHTIGLICLFLFVQCKGLEVGKVAPDFKANSVQKGEISLQQFRGKKVLLSFMRNVGCPICNLHTHHLYQYQDSLQKLGVVVLMIHQSPTNTIQTYLAQDDRVWSFLFVSDSERILYDLYKVKPSIFRFLASGFYGALRKRKEGVKLYKTKIKQEGKRGMLGADFLLDESGKIIKVHYARFIGDHLLPAEIYHTFAEKEGK